MLSARDEAGHDLDEPPVVGDRAQHGDDPRELLPGRPLVDEHHDGRGDGRDGGTCRVAFGGYDDHHVDRRWTGIGGVAARRAADVPPRGAAEQLAHRLDV